MIDGESSRTSLYDPSDSSTDSSTPDTAPEVSIVVVSYNTKELTLACLRSVTAETTVPHEVIVIDNDSSDGSASAIAGEFPDATLIRESFNHGFAVANNIAIERARGHFVLLLNPDTVVLDAAIDRIVEFAHHRPSARIWGGRTVFADGSLNASNCWRRMTVWTLFCRMAGLDNRFLRSAIFNREAYGGWDRGTERAVDIVSGCFLLIERSVWDQLAGFDPTFVMYGEEVDLCLRARTLGANPRITPAATIVHHGGASERVRSDKYVRILTAKSTLIRRYMAGGRRLVALGLLRLWPLTRLIATRTVGLVVRSNGVRPQTEDWADVWSRRSEWAPGYPDVGSFTST
jgi:GT2 family glycosyltransferase